MATQAETLMQAGKDAFRAGEHDRALDLFDQALQADPRCCEAYIARAAVHQSRGQADKIIEECERAIAVQSDHALAYSTRAVAYQMLGQHARSLQDLTRAIELQPENFLQYAARAKTYIKMEAFEKAADDFQKAAQVELEVSKRLGKPPQEAVPLMLARVEMLRRAGKENEAQEVEREARELEKTLSGKPGSGCGKAAAVILLLLWWVF